MKIQELLTSLKSKMPFTYEHSFEVGYDEGIAIIYSYDIDGCPSYFMPLAQLLFSTPFLSLLEWEDNINYSEHTIKYKSAIRIETYRKDYITHKINLVLLNTDAERIKYIEAFTL